MVISLSSTTHYSHSSPPASFILDIKHHATTVTACPIVVKSSGESQFPTTSAASISDNLRRPNSQKPLRPNPTSPKPKLSKNPLKNLINPTNNPVIPSENLTNKLRLTSKLSPSLPPPPPPPPPEIENDIRDSDNSGSEQSWRIDEFRQEGKIFVGNLPLWIKKNDLTQFFRQFGPIKNVILIKGHDDNERNLGFGFVIYGGPAAAQSAIKAVEFDGMDFHGRILTVKLDDGRRMKAKAADRVRWVQGEDQMDYRSKWHEERDILRVEFKKVLETQPEKWQAVVKAFERIKKVWLISIQWFLLIFVSLFGCMVW